MNKIKKIAIFVSFLIISTNLMACDNDNISDTIIDKSVQKVSKTIENKEVSISINSSAINKSIDKVVEVIKDKEITPEEGIDVVKNGYLTGGIDVNINDKK